MKDMRNRCMHQCNYCDQIFQSKEKLYEHLEVHSDADRRKEEENRRKKAKPRGKAKKTK